MKFKRRKTNADKKRKRGFETEFMDCFCALISTKGLWSKEFLDISDVNASD